MKLLIATKNIAKINEYKKFFEIMPELEILTLNDIGIFDDVEETGSTFFENALLKAKTYAKKSDILTLSEDGGLEIEVLGNEPGVYSRRWPGHEASDLELIKYALEKLQNIALKYRKAKISCITILYNPKTDEFISFTADIEGKIAEKFDGRVIDGFPYRSIFQVEEFNKLLIDLTDEEHEQINHRKKIVEQIVNYFNQTNNTTNN